MLKHEGLNEPSGSFKMRPLMATAGPDSLGVEVADSTGLDCRNHHWWITGHACAAQVRHIIAGTAARTMAQAFIHPIDTVKTRLQVCT